MAFIDADKSAYPAYYEALVPLMRSGGLIVADNVLRHGRVLDAGADDPSVTGMREFNDRVATDPRVEAVMLTVRDGISLIRVRDGGRRLPAGRLTVLYDARCRVCTRIAARFAGLDRGRRLRLRPLAVGPRGRLASVRRLRAERDLRRALHVIDEDGDWAEGGEAMLRVLERVPCAAATGAARDCPASSDWSSPATAGSLATGLALQAGWPVHSAPRSASVGERRAARMAG